MKTALLWFRQDLRLSDNPALSAAIERGGLVVPVFIWAPDEEGDWPPGGASRWWLHQSLESLANDLQSRGSNLLIRVGPTLDTLQDLAKETDAEAVLWNRRYEPAIIDRDKRIKTALAEAGLEAVSYSAALLNEPWSVQNKSGKPFQVFTPFWKTCLNLAEPPAPLPSPRNIPSPGGWPKGVQLRQLELQPQIDWAVGLRETWTPGETGAGKQLKQFLHTAMVDYSTNRNRPDLQGTSRLSPHLHFGEISPRQVWHSLREEAERSGLPASQWRGSQFLAEIGWREFSHHLIHHFPHTPQAPLRPEFEQFPWRQDEPALRAWQKGQTGYPIVDAGMRELWYAGWMHNRVRMIVASFLVKDLLIPWQEGASWFWDTLVDADLAQNTLGWQWTAGCGADAAPYFRVFNPTMQGEKFDPHGDYVRKWVPELSALPRKWIHRPHEASPEILAGSGVQLGETYPEPIVSHAIARNVALDAYERIRKQR